MSIVYYLDLLKIMTKVMIDAFVAIFIKTKSK